MKSDNLDQKEFYQTSEVARILDISPSLLRHYITPFEGHLTLFRTSGKHRRFTKETIEEIENLISLLVNKGITEEYLTALVKAIEIKDIVNEHLGEEKYTGPVINENDKLIWNEMSPKLDALIQIENDEKAGILKIEQLLEEISKRNSGGLLKRR